MFLFFATGTIMNASSFSEEEQNVEVSDYCNELYFEVRDAVYDMTFGNEFIAISAAIAAESACIAETEELLEIP